LVELKARGGQLFCHLTLNKYDDLSSAFSKRINSRIHKIFGGDRRLVLECLRNTAAAAMRRAKVDPDERRAFLGHAPIDVHQENYSSVTTTDLLEAARVVSDMVREALEGEQIPRLDITYQKRRIVGGKSALNVSDEIVQREDEELPTLD
jgi:hypothetical protein